MTEIKSRLFKAFRDDHALLGRSLFELGERLQARDVSGARQAARQLDSNAGAHIAFEQDDFYPALVPFLTNQEMVQMYKEHSDGRALLAQVESLGDDSLEDTVRRDGLLEQVHLMEQHVSECGELFGIMGGLDDAAQQQLLERLEFWRIRAPRWSELELPQACHPSDR